MDASRFPEIFFKKMRVYRDRKKAPVEWLRAAEVPVPVGSAWFGLNVGGPALQ